MKIELKEKPHKPIVVEGFPGIGLVGTITTEFLIEHLKARQIGSIWSDDIPAIIAIHENKVVHPLGIFYSEKYNLIIIHAITNIEGKEWMTADEVMKICKELDAYKLISVESVGNPNPTEDSKVFYYANNKEDEDKLKKIGLKPLEEGIIMGVTGALLLKTEGIKFSCLFGETHSQLPDSKAAARIVEYLDKFLGLDVDPAPLLKSAEKFEKKLRAIIEQGAQAKDIDDKKKISYVG